MTEVQRIEVSMLRRGMMIDLEGDPYADPDHDDVSYQFDFAVVEYVGPLTDEGLVLVELRDGDVIGFPPDHEVNWSGQWFYRPQKEESR